VCRSLCRARCGVLEDGGMQSLRLCHDPGVHVGPVGGVQREFFSAPVKSPGRTVLDRTRNGRGLRTTALSDDRVKPLDPSPVARCTQEDPSTGIVSLTTAAAGGAPSGGPGWVTFGRCGGSARWAARTSWWPCLRALRRRPGSTDAGAAPIAGVSAGCLARSGGCFRTGTDRSIRARRRRSLQADRHTTYGEDGAWPRSTIRL
jgi:hypothetical protein